jgi:hypothetical protein
MSIEEKLVVAIEREKRLISAQPDVGIEAA